MDAVVHFGGIPRHKPHEDIFKNIIDHNIVGTYNVFEACRINKGEKNYICKFSTYNGLS